MALNFLPSIIQRTFYYWDFGVSRPQFPTFILDMREPGKQFLAIQKGDQKAFETIFRDYYQELFFYACKFVGKSEQAEELVQDVFVHIWEKRSALNIRSSLKSYLYTAVRNRCLNHLKSQMARMEKDTDASLQHVRHTSPYSADLEVNRQELMRLIQQGIQQLPDRCRIIFKLSRDADMTYAEIATELGISKETVKSQIKVALERLRAHLGKYWELITWLGWMMIVGLN